MIDTSAIAQGESRRAEIESATDAFLKSGGKIQYLPDSIGKPAPVRASNFNNSINAEAEARSRARGVRNSALAKGGNTVFHKKMRADNVAAITPLLHKGLSTEEIAEQIGLTQRAVRRIIHAEGLCKPARRSKAA
ncbi:hypothetical protein [Stutzerimonas stutzeri]|uniref:hypothetical protein n=1 Tax=Stutzerimonas stutzeri TaxID=316 RepID=UPI00220E3CFF|nr:hypothetical protein [Stutzerimonas stutzeri]UVO19551.1 hypothetical protein KN217_07575 [Stutzerimonas stutzeri]